MWLFEANISPSLHMELARAEFSINFDPCVSRPSFIETILDQTGEDVQRRLKSFVASIRITSDHLDFSNSSTAKKQAYQDFIAASRECSDQRQLESIASIFIFRNKLAVEASIEKLAFKSLMDRISLYDPRVHSFYLMLDFLGFSTQEQATDFFSGREVYALVSGVGFNFRAED